MGIVRLRPTEGTQKYIRAIRYHVRATKRSDATREIGQQLAPFEARLVAAQRDVDDALAQQSEATADANIEDSRGDDLARNLYDDVKKADRADRTVGLKAKVFPDGLSATVARTGDAQADELEKLAGRLTEHSQPLAAEYVTRLQQAARDIRQAEINQEAAVKLVAEASGRRALVKLRVREQFEANAGALRVLFKGNVRHADRFFQPAKARTRTDPVVEDDDDQT